MVGKTDVRGDLGTETWDGVFGAGFNTLVPAGRGLKMVGKTEGFCWGM